MTSPTNNNLYKQAIPYVGLASLGCLLGSGFGVLAALAADDLFWGTIAALGGIGAATGGAAAHMMRDVDDEAAFEESSSPTFKV